MEVWPFVPTQEMTEALEWRTDVIRSKGAEQRLALLDAPRQAFELRHLFLEPRQLARARALAYGIGVDEMAVPAWHEYERLGPVSSGVWTIAVDTTTADYREGGYAVLWEDDETYELLQVESLDASSVTLAASVQSDYSAAYLMPARVARAPQGVSFARQAGNEVRASLNAEAIDGLDLGANPGYPLYRGHAVMTDVSKVSGGIAESVLREVEVLDNGIGVPWFDPRYTLPTERFTLAWHVFERAALWDLRRWLHSRRGKQKGFWLPTWNADLELLQNIGAAATTISVRAVGWPDLYGVRDVMFLTHAGQAYYRRITGGVAGAPGAETLTLEAALGVNLDINEVRIVSLMHFVRQAVDRVELQHTAQEGSRVSVQCEEVPLP